MHGRREETWRTERETIIRMWYMRDKSVFNKRRKIKKTQKYPIKVACLPNLLNMHIAPLHTFMHLYTEP